MSSNEKIIITNITLGYADSEDRLWARLILANGKETRIWLTRRMTLGLANGLADLLEKTDGPDQQINPEKILNSDDQKHLNNELMSALNEKADETPEPPAPNTIEMFGSGLCHTINITPGNPWLIVFEAPGQGFALPAERKIIFKLMHAFRSQADQAEWSPPTKHSWLNRTFSPFIQKILGQYSPKNES